MAKLENLRIGDRSIGHVDVNPGSTVEPDSGPSSSSHGFIVATRSVAENHVVHGALGASHFSKSEQQRINQSLADLDVASRNRRGDLRITRKTRRQKRIIGENDLDGLE